MVNRENSTLMAVPHWARTPPFALLVDPIPGDSRRSTTRTRCAPARRSCKATARPTAPAPTTTTRRSTLMASATERGKLVDYASALDDHQLAGLRAGKHLNLVQRVAVHDQHIGASTGRDDAQLPLFADKTGGVDCSCTQDGRSRLDISTNGELRQLGVLHCTEQIGAIHDRGAAVVGQLEGMEAALEHGGELPIALFR